MGDSCYVYEVMLFWALVLLFVGVGIVMAELDLGSYFPKATLGYGDFPFLPKGSGNRSYFDEC